MQTLLFMLLGAVAITIGVVITPIILISLGLRHVGESIWVGIQDLRSVAPPVKEKT